MAINRTGHDESEESFFVSMTDIMVGLLFIFIILVVYFVLQVRIETQKVRFYEDEYGPEQSQRSQLDHYRIAVSKQQNIILEGLQSFFESEGFTDVTIDRNSGVLRFPDGVLFGSGEYDFEDGSQTAKAVKTLANAFAEVLPCSVLDAKGNRFRSKADCRRGHTSFPNPNNAFVESIYIEGHTDSIPVGSMGLRGDAKLSTNLKLSTRRATNTYEEVIGQRPEVENFYGLASFSKPSEPALAVSGYGEQRPIADNSSSEGRSANRRIDVRIVMYRPYDFEDLEVLRERLTKVLDKQGGDDLG
ncbi:hypothetical protein OAO91_05770 [Luminiphilus sp.]|nr:hypothetical protein [Luminiphilus sp.]